MTIRYINMFRALIQHKESEVVEFKKAENNFDFDDLGKYFSALSNEANLRGLDFAWLVFGYDEKRHEIVARHIKTGKGLSTISSTISLSIPTMDRHSARSSRLRLMGSGYLCSRFRPRHEIS